MALSFNSKIALLASAMMLFSAPLRAQGRHELAFSLGAGSLFVHHESASTPVFSFSYQFHFTKNASAEGALDCFTYRFLTGPLDQQSYYRDGYTGAAAALVYNFRDYHQVGKWIPFVSAGIGKTTTDFTEIRASVYYRFGSGVTYHFTEKYGIRLELRDEVITGLYANGSPRGNLPSVRAAIVRRF